MAGMLCCNPINVDDDIDDMELEDVWELQRSRSKLKSSKQQVNKNSSKNNKGKKNNKLDKKLKPSKNYQMKRVKSTGKKNKNSIMGRSSSALKPRGPPSINQTFSNRSRSTGRPKPTTGGWGLNFGSAKEKKVSISNYVEKIDYPPEKKIEGRGRPVRAPPVRRSRSKSIGADKKKKWFGKKKKKKKEVREEEYDSSSDSDSYDNDYDERPNFFSMM